MYNLNLKQPRRMYSLRPPEWQKTNGWVCTHIYKYGSHHDELLYCIDLIPEKLKLDFLR